MSFVWIPVISIIGGIGLVIVMVVAGSAGRQRRAQLRAEVQMKLIDRFGTADEFVRFVQSDEGRRFLGDPPAVARKGYIGGIRWGIIMGFIGVAFALIAFTEHDRGFFIPAFILIGLGGGFFVSAMFSMKLAKQMEALPDDSPRP